MAFYYDSEMGGARRAGINVARQGGIDTLVNMELRGRLDETFDGYQIMNCGAEPQHFRNHHYF